MKVVSNPQNVATALPPVASLSKREFARRHSSSQRTVDNWVAAGCPVLRVSTRKLLFPIEDCDNWIRERFLVARRKPSALAAERNPAGRPTATCTEGRR